MSPTYSSSHNRSFPRPALATVLLAFVAMLSASPAEARVVARATISRAHGGTLRARDGAELYVPPGALSEGNAQATISTVRPAKFEFAIRGGWHGQVRVTLPAPPAGWAPVVLHTVRGVNTVESKKLGEMSVWVDHLSTFEPIPQACLDVLYGTAEGGPEAAGPSFATCLAAYGVVEVTALGVQELASLVSQASQPALPGGTSTGTRTLPVGQGAPITIQGTSPVLQGGRSPQPEPPSASSPAPLPSSSPEPSPPPTSTEGFVIEDSIYGGTWARTDPDDGTWYPHSTPPPNGAYWYPNGLGVAVSCAQSAAPYTAVVYGVAQTWSWWAHVTDGEWVPTVVFSSVWSDGLPAGLPEC
jgi:hypothetical protein